MHRALAGLRGYRGQAGRYQQKEDIQKVEPGYVFEEAFYISL